MFPAVEDVCTRHITHKVYKAIKLPDQSKTASGDTDYSTGLKSGSIFVIHQTNSVIAMLLKKSSDVYLQMNHNAIREIRYSPILGALQYYAKINAAWSLL